MSLSNEWVQLKIRTGEPHVEALEDWLFEQGALSITYQDAEDEPILEPTLGETPLWSEVIVTALFTRDADTRGIRAILEKHDLNENLSWARWEVLEDKDWVRAWMDNYHAMQFGERLWICPSWQEPPEPEAVNIMLDPGLAFGTGTHPTTALCLSWLDSHAEQYSEAIDYGCGSGILAIAALKLGVKEVLAIDYDPQAVIATKDNALRNHIDLQRLEICLPEDAPVKQTHLMIANILADTLKSLVDTLCSKVAEGGTIIMSGILDSQAESVMAAYQSQFEFEEPVVQDEWVLLVGKKIIG